LAGSEAADEEALRNLGEESNGEEERGFGVREEEEDGAFFAEKQKEGCPFRSSFQETNSPNQNQESLDKECGAERDRLQSLIHYSFIGGSGGLHCARE
jgi:hypothetical protein